MKGDRSKCHPSENIVAHLLADMKGTIFYIVPKNLHHALAIFNRIMGLLTMRYRR
jgi:hypothetical protein